MGDNKSSAAILKIWILNLEIEKWPNHIGNQPGQQNHDLR